jgi:hypothetical protein
MTSFWILLFIICLPKTGSTGENPADHGHYTHDLSLPPLPQCPPFVEAGTPDLLWLYKSQRKAWKKGGRLEKERPENQKKKEQNRGIEPKIIGGTEKENPAHRGRKVGEDGEKKPEKKPAYPASPSSSEHGQLDPKTRGKKKKRKTTGGKKESRNRRKAGETGKKKQRNAQK